MCSLFLPCQERPCSITTGLGGVVHPAYHSAWHTEVAASRMLINFILHSTDRGKDRSVAAPSNEVLSKHNTPGICEGLGVGVLGREACLDG